MKQKIADFLNVFFGMRKFIAWLLLFFIAVIFRVKSFLNGTEFVDLMKSTFLAFTAANGVEHVITCVKDYHAGKTAVALAQQDEEIVPSDGQEADDAKAEAGSA